MTRPIEPGLLALFRSFVALGILLLVLRVALSVVSEPAGVASPIPGIVLLALLLGYLSWPALATRFGRAYLPVALLYAIGLAILGAAASTTMRLDAGVRAEDILRGSWVLIVVLLVPLILVAWQYGFRWVLWFCVLTAVAEIAFMAPLAARGGPPLLTVAAIALVRSLFFLPVGYAVARLVDAQRQQRVELAKANARLARHATTLEELAVSRERNRFAHELHDTLAHGLSSVAVQLEAVNALWNAQPERARDMLAEALATTRTALAEARRAIVALRASPLEELGLAQAIRELAESTAVRARLALVLRLPASSSEMSKDAEHAVYRIVDEALTNVVRHAQARHLTVTVDESDEALRVAVADDGVGFDTTLAREGEHLGLRGMRERAHLQGADLAIESAAGSGTTVRLALRRERDTRPYL